MSRRRATGPVWDNTSFGVQTGTLHCNQRTDISQWTLDSHSDSKSDTESDSKSSHLSHSDSKSSRLSHSDSNSSHSSHPSRLVRRNAIGIWEVGKTFVVLMIMG